MFLLLFLNLVLYSQESNGTSFHPSSQNATQNDPEAESNSTSKILKRGSVPSLNNLTRFVYTWRVGVLELCERLKPTRTVTDNNANVNNNNEDERIELDQREPVFLINNRRNRFFRQQERERREFAHQRDLFDLDFMDPYLSYNNFDIPYLLPPFQPNVRRQREFRPKIVNTFLESPPFGSPEDPDIKFYLQLLPRGAPESPPSDKRNGRILGAVRLFALCSNELRVKMQISSRPCASRDSSLNYSVREKMAEGNTSEAQ